MSLLPVILSIFASAQISPAEPVRIEGLQGLGNTQHHVIESESLGKSYDVLVGLPDGYDETDDTSYPTVYILDGGAQDFQTFLRDELIPFIEASYRSRRNRRIIFGQSLGGQFVLYSAQTQPTLFWGHIASNPALHRNLELFLTMMPEIPPDESKSYLFVGGGSLDDRRFREPRSQWVDYWTAREPKPWHLRVETLDGHTHMSAPPASFRRGIRWLFSDP